MRSILISYAADDVKIFNESLTEYKLSLKNTPEALKNIKLEIIFNKLNIFVKAAWLYLIYFISCMDG